MPLLCVGPCRADLNQRWESCQSYCVLCVPRGGATAMTPISAAPSLALYSLNTKQASAHRSRLGSVLSPPSRQERLVHTAVPLYRVGEPVPIFNLPPIHTARSGLFLASQLPSTSGIGSFPQVFCPSHRLPGFTGQNFITTTASSATSPPSLPWLSP